MTRLALLFLATALFAPLALACGGGSRLPDPSKACASPTATPTRGPTRGDPNFLYVRAVRDGITGLEELTDGFRRRWPDRRFSSTPEFRQEFVDYAASSHCLATNLRSLEPFDASRMGQFDHSLEPLLQSYLDVMEEGLEAVRKRNVSDYRDFHRDIDQAQRALSALLATFPDR